jgi:hypothetical protein
MLSHDLRREDDSFYYRAGYRKPVVIMSLECKAWRHQRDEDIFEFRISASDDVDLEGLITGRVSASNLSDPVEVRLPLRITFEDRDVTELAEQLVVEFERRRAIISKTAFRLPWAES